MTLPGAQIRIANAGGYWGDDPAALRRQVRGGPVDYVVSDFLAEVTMSILQKQRARDPDGGFARDFIDQIDEVLPDLVERGIRVLSNAGGLNPAGCARALLERAHARGLELSVGVVSGDDLTARIGELRGAGEKFSNLDTGEPFEGIADRVVVANAYFGAAPVAAALKAGAQVVVCGRVTDTGITLAAMLHAFGWSLDDYDKLAAGIIAGHVLECGAQASGGNLTDWNRVPDLANVGYPIAEVSGDGTVVITKHEGTGGEVSIASVSEQLLYEMGRPDGYITPDVVADFTSIRLESDGPHRVLLRGVRGSAPPATLKVSMAHQQGYKASGALIVSRPHARDKAEAFARIFWERLEVTPEATLTELIGLDACHGPLAPASDPNEILLRLGVRDDDRAKVDAFSKLLPSLILSGPSGVAVTGGRPRIQEVIAYWPTLVRRDRVGPQVHVASSSGAERALRFTWPPIAPGAEPAPAAPPEPPPLPSGGPTRPIRLRRIAYGRSGDKGDTCNIGIIARSTLAYSFLRERLTAEWVAERFGRLCRGKVERFEVPNLLALNFLLHEALGGGGTVSLRIDAQGKTLAPALLECRMEIPEAVLASVPWEDWA